jgi:hypothetical protein
MASGAALVAGLTLGAVVNDPFIHQHFAGIELVAHVNPVLAVRVDASSSPSFGEGDWKPVTRELSDRRVSPDVSRILDLATIELQFTPIRGELEGRHPLGFDVHAMAGFGAVSTREDDWVDLMSYEFPDPNASVDQVHPVTSYGAGLRVQTGPRTSLALDWRQAIYVETVWLTTLEMKNERLFVAGVGWRIGRIRA